MLAALPKAPGIPQALSARAGCSPARCPDSPCPCGRVLSLSATTRDAQMNRRSRRWGAPTAAAGIWTGHASKPSASMSARTRASPSSALARPGTFSTRRSRAPVRRARSRKSGQRSRSSSWPLRRPATLHGWQGMPPARRSTRPKAAKSSSPRAQRSDRTGTSGQWMASSARHRSSRSTRPTMRQPASSRPRASPPMPEQTSTARITAPLPGMKMPRCSRLRRKRYAPRDPSRR